MSCKLCNKYSKEDLCFRHSRDYVLDPQLDGYRLKKRGRGSRYNTHKFHITETRLAKIIEYLYGKSNVFVSFYPLWAKSGKGVLYEYDIVVPKEKLIVLYNGRQHYEFVEFFHKNLKAFLRQIVRDKVKRQIADTNGYRLIEFKYTEPIMRDYISHRLEE
jgi:hypothetical protein